jgi:hypothetical protein
MAGHGGHLIDVLVLVLHRRAYGRVSHDNHDREQVLGCPVHLRSEAMACAVENQILWQSCICSSFFEIVRPSLSDARTGLVSTETPILPSARSIGISSMWSKRKALSYCGNPPLSTPESTRNFKVPSRRPFASAFQVISCQWTPSKSGAISTSWAG